MKLYEVKGGKDFSFSCIYMWENLINHKKYVGQAQNFYVRMARYKGGHFTNPHITYAIKKYGLENFDIRILEKDVPVDKLDEREQYWMDFYQVCNPDLGYNICPIAGSCRGMTAWNKGISVTPEIKEKISKGLLNYYSEHEVWNKGIPATEEAKEKNRQSNLGEKNGMYGRKQTEESKEKNRQWHLGRHPSKETRNKMSRPVICIETGIRYDSLSIAGEAMGCSETAIWNNINGKSKSCMGYHWKYAD